MKIEKNRHMMIMYSPVHAAGPLTAEQIGEASRASVRTVKSDIAYLNKELSRYSEARIVNSGQTAHGRTDVEAV